MKNNSNVNNLEQISTIESIQSTGNGSIKIGDINKTVNQYYSEPSDSFKKERVHDSQSTSIPNPLDGNKQIKAILEKRLLVLGGNHEDKADLARYIATKVLEKITINSDNNIDYVLTLEGKFIESRTNIVKLCESTSEKEENANNIYILYDLKPGQVNNDLLKIIENATKYDYYVIVTTEVPKNQWLEQKEDKFCWWELSTEDLYDPQDLAKTLIKNIDDNTIGDELKLYIQEVVSLKLKTFTSVGRCLRFINALKESLSKSNIDEAVGSAKDKKESLKKWYINELEERERLLAIGLSFFDGLFEDQLFAALEKVVETVWQRRDRDLQAIDYSDLGNFGNHHNKFEDKEEYNLSLNTFEFVKQESYVTEVEIHRSQLIRSDERRILFEVAWEFHRRQILSALPIIVELVLESVNRYSYNWELYGDKIRCQRLRNVMSETLSDLGLVSQSATSAVESALIRLAENNNFEVQDVAARAISEWYRQDRKKGLRTLQRFYSFAIEENDSPEGKQKRGYVGATVALTIGYAAIEDFNKLNKLSDELCDWLKELANNQSDSVRKYFCDYTLSKVIPLHLKQLHDNSFLKNIVEEQDDENLHFAVAFNLSIAAQINSWQVRDTLNSWYDNCENNWINKNKGHEYKHLMQTVALSYGLIDYDKTYNDLTFKHGFRCLHKILVENKFESVCKLVVLSICLLSRDKIDDITSLFDDLLIGFTQEVKNSILTQLKEIYQEKVKIPQELQDFPQKELDPVLRSIGLVYMLENRSFDKKKLTVKETFWWLYDILDILDKINSKIAIKETIYTAIRILANKYFDQIEVELKLAATKISSQNRKYIAEIFTQIYLDQRANLKEGEKNIVINEFSYPIWINSKRPLTNIEQSMFRWLKQDKNPELNSTLMQAFVSFASELDQEEETYIQENIKY
jgi:hypothetical protein